jgi:hypothetical protein
MILCDTGPLVAAFNAADRDHVRCAAFLRENWSRLVVPSLAVTEVCHLPADRQRRGRPSWRQSSVLRSRPMSCGSLRPPRMIDRSLGAGWMCRQQVQLLIPRVKCEKRGDPGVAIECTTVRCFARSQVLPGDQIRACQLADPCVRFRHGHQAEHCCGR